MDFLFYLKIVTALFGLAINAFLLKVMSMKKENTFSDRLLTSYFITALIQGISYVPGFFTPFYTLADYTCDLEAFPPYMLANVHVIHIEILTLHRILLTEFPFFARDLNFKPHLVYISSFVAYLFGGLIALPPLVGWSQYTKVSGECSVDWVTQTGINYAYIGFCMFLAFILPVIILLLNIMISPLSKKVGASSNKENNDYENPSEEMSRAKYIKLKKYKNSCIMMMATFISLWLPYVILCVCATFLVDVSYTLYGISTVIAKSSSFLVPISHVLVYRHSFKERIKKIFSNKRIKMESVELRKDSAELN